MRKKKVNQQLEKIVIQFAYEERIKTWSREQLTREVNRQNVAEPVSCSTICRILQKHGFKLVIKVVETKTKTLIDKCLELTAYDAQYRMPWIIFDRDVFKVRYRFISKNCSNRR